MKKKYGDDLYFYNKNIEVDFFIPKEHRAIQISYSIADDMTRQREVKDLVKLSEVYVLEQLEIVTWDEETTIRENSLNIQVIPMWKWLLE